MKYNIEGNFDFYSELKQEQKEQQECQNSGKKQNQQQEETDESKMCLITRTPLIDGFVEMECGHKFNYRSIYNELMNQIKPSICGYSKPGRIQCPFCRHSQQTLIPIRPDYTPVLGVSLYPPKMYKHDVFIHPSGTHTCHFDSPTEQCSSEGCMYQLKNGKCYCYAHKKWGMSQDLQEDFNQEFLNAKAKKKEKLDAIVLKKQQKLDSANAKKNASSVVVVVVEGICSQLLKTGPKKGTPCGCKKVVQATSLCRRHS